METRCFFGFVTGPSGCILAQMSKSTVYIVLVLLVFVLGMNLIATIIRSRARARRPW